MTKTQIRLKCLFCNYSEPHLNGYSTVDTLRAHNIERHGKHFFACEVVEVKEKVQ